MRTLRTLTDGGADHAFEVVGLPETMLVAWKSLRPGATAIVVGLAAKGVDVDTAGDRAAPGQGDPRIVLRLRGPVGRDPRAGTTGPGRKARPRGRRVAPRHARRRRGGARPPPPRRGGAYHPRSGRCPRGRADTEPREAAMTTTTDEPRSVTDVVADLSIRAQAFIDGAYVDAASGETFDCVEPDRRRGRRHGRGVRLGRRRPRRRGRARRLRVGRLVAPCPQEAEAGAPAARRADGRARRGARAARDHRHGEADPRRDERGRAARDRVHRLVRRGDRQGLRRDRARPARTRMSRSCASRSA